jgi:5'-3' exonuclease
MKFGVDGTNADSVNQLVHSYLQGLFWVLTYYHFGCASWDWFYPHLYAPLASDFRNLSLSEISFVKSRPFTPLLQLLSVLPPQSFHLLPASYAIQSNQLEKYFPHDFVTDLNGKKNVWECVVQIPFIDEKDLVTKISEIDHIKNLTLSERARNLPGTNHHYHIQQQPTNKDIKLDRNKSKRFRNALRSTTKNEV